MSFYQLASSFNVASQQLWKLCLVEDVSEVCHIIPFINAFIFTCIVLALCFVSSAKISYHMCVGIVSYNIMQLYKITFE